MNSSTDTASIAQRNRFLSHLTHDVRGVVSGLEGVLSLLDHANQDDACQEYIDAARSTARRLSIILLNILETARVESGNMAFNRIPFNFHESIKELLALYGKIAADKGLSFNVDIDKAMKDNQHGDPVLLKRVLTNLLDNAVRYTQTGSVNVSIHPLAVPGPAIVQFRIEDSGTGMPDALLDSMFEAYSNDHDTVGAGSRLGLPLAAMLTKLMGGQLSYSHVENGGSCFTLELPMSPMVDTDRQTPRASEIPVFKGKRVLLVEDIEDNRRVMLQLLQVFEVTADGAASGEEAIELCSTNDYDLVLMDCQMPDMDGFEASRRIRELASASVATIVALTGIGDLGTRSKALDAGMDDYYLKPVSLELLTSILQKYLG